MPTPNTMVQIIQSHNDLVLIQWTDNDNILRRTWVKESNLLNLQGRKAEVVDPKDGFPYGVEFWRLVELKADSKDLDRELKARGIWTVADVRNRPHEVVGALAAIYGIDLAALLIALEKYEKDLSTEA